MIHLTRQAVRRWLDVLLHIDDTPERTAAAFALGVFFGFSPFLGFHTILAIIFAFFLNLNRVAALLGVYSNLPWFLGPYYALATRLGAQITGHRPPRGFLAQLRALFESVDAPRRILASAGYDSATVAVALHRGIDHRGPPPGGGGVSPCPGVRDKPAADS